MIFPNTQYSSSGEFTPIPLAITTASLKNAVMAYAQHTRILPSGPSPYNWSITSGALPAGLTLDTNGLITGTWLDQLLLLASDEVVVLGENSALYRRYTAEGRGTYTYSLLGTLPAGFTFSVDTLSGSPWAPDVNTKLLMHFDGTQGSSAIDLMGKVVTVAGVGTISSTIKKNNSYSIQASASTDYSMMAASNDWVFPGDFTFECWFNRPVTVDSTVCGQYPANNAYLSWNIDSTRFGFWGNSSTMSASFAATWSLNTWHHAALVRASGVIKAYLDGTQVGSSYNNSSSVGYNNLAMGLGTLGSSGGSMVGGNGTIGNFDDYRISKGIARYTANFVPPTTFTDDSYTMCHVVANSGFADAKI